MAPLLVVLLVLCVAWLVRVRTVRTNLTKDQKDRRAALHKIAPYVKGRRRDAPGQALKRGAYMAWVSGKISTRERDLFAGRRVK